MWPSFSGYNVFHLCLLSLLAWRSTCFWIPLLHQLPFKSAPCSSTQTDCSCLLWKFSNSHPCIKEGWDNLRTLLMHFISINVLLAQDQKDGGNLNFLMKVISSSLPPILRVIRLCTIREATWDSGLWRDMPGPVELGGELKWDWNVGLGI